MNSYYHSKSSSRKWGGQWRNYKDIHDFLDHTKAHVADMRHRSLLHNSWGIYIVEQIFGEVIEVPGEHSVREIPTRLIAERHIVEDLGKIPSVQDYLSNMQLRPWMHGSKTLGQSVAGSLSLPSLEEVKDLLKP